MTFKKVEGGGRINLSKQTEGSEWVGVYTKGYEVDSQIAAAGKQNVWQLTDDDGNETEFWGCASLDMKMKQVPLNSIVKIRLAGKYMTKYKKEAASVEVEFDDTK